MMDNSVFSRQYLKRGEIYCTRCGARLASQPGFREDLHVWICTECGQVLYGEEQEGKHYPGVSQICDHCGAILDNQEGFSDWYAEWKCADCGTVNIIEDAQCESVEKLQYEKWERSGSMTTAEARSIEKEFWKLSNPSDEQEFLYIEAMNFLIEEENKPEDMMHLGGYYYEQKNFDFARKYYEMAAAFDIDAADECLGYIWYYGRTGERDYEKAFRHYSRSMKRGNLVSAYKVADMYKNGYFVEKDYEKYVSIIEELYPKVSHARYLNEPLPEVYTRLAKIRVSQERIDEAIDLYYAAKDFLAQRISFSGFFGDLSIMKWLIDDLYELVEFDEDYFDFYDLFYLLRRPAKIRFTYEHREQELESLIEDGACVVHFNDKWYRSREEFFQKARIGDEKLTRIYDRLEDLREVSD